MSRGFDAQLGLYNALGDHWKHTLGSGYDWHSNQTIDFSAAGVYSGELIRNAAVKFLEQHSAAEPKQPFFLYLPFQEAHSPYQAPKQYADMYPELSAYPEQQNLAGMVTHTGACGFTDACDDPVQML